MEEMDAAQLAPELTEDDTQLQAILEAIVYIKSLNERALEPLIASSPKP